MSTVAGMVGNYTHNLDQKNRLALPAKFRAELGDTFILTASPSGEPCLVAYSQDAWDESIAEITLSINSKEERMYKMRRIYYNTEKIELDAQGRMTIPARLVEKAHFRRSVFMLGVDKRVEFWDPDLFEKTMAESVEDEESVKTFFMQ